MSIRAWQAHISDFAQLLQTGQKTVAPARLPTMVCWPATEMGAALALLADKSGLPMTKANRELSPTRNALPPPQLENPAALDRWVGLVAEHLGLEAEPIQSTYTEAATCLAHAGPALLQLPTGDVSSEPAFVALVQGGRRYHQLITRDGSLQSVRHDVLRDALWADIIGSQGASIGQLLQNAGIAAERRPRVQRAILQEMLGTKSRHNGWLLRITPRVPLWQQTQQANLLGTAARLVTGYFAQLLLTIGAWWMIGQSTLVGHFEWGWLLGWALLLLTTVPFQAWVNITQNELAIGIGAVFKQRLLFGVLQLDPEEIRHQGAGQFLGRVLASDTVEQLGLASGFISILALFQLVAAVFILALGIGGWFHGLLLLLWVGLTIGLSAFYLHRSRLWAESHREMTNDLVERMVGHRTRLAQEEQGQWHTLEDQILGHYLQRQRQLDQVESQLKALVPRGWMAIGVGSLLYALLFTHPTATQIALSLGGILFAYQALTTVMLGLKSLVSTRLAWQEIRTIFHAATRIQAANHSVYLPHKGDITADATQSPIVTV
ncbi:MAG: ABC transporter ATP-binding protein, partial [Caldilineaceae bacterium]|nr:ABC transporter ATP-binding protein [Caldilineaceae bacterium]